MDNTSMKPYIEIVHHGPVRLEDYMGRPRLEATARRIIDLEGKANIHYVMYGVTENLPNVPKDTPIRVGGYFWEWCVQARARALQKAGYQNAHADREISFAEADEYADLGFFVNSFKAK